MSYQFEANGGLFRHDSFTSAAIVFAFVLAGVVAGYVVSTGRPIPIALTLGAIGGVALLNALPSVIWVILLGVLFVSGPLFMFVPALEKAGWLFSVLGFFLVGASILYPAIGRDRFTRPPPAFVVWAVVLFAFGMLSLFYSGGPLAEGIRAGKRWFQFIGLLFILAVVPFPPALVRKWWGMLVVLAMIQLPFALYQRVVLVPLREGMPGVFPIDIVVGTMEGSIRGGGSSSVMALLLLFVLAFLLAAYREGIVPTRRLLPIAVLVATPLLLTEVTAIVVLIPVALAAIYFDLIRARPMRFVLGTVAAMPLLAAAGWAVLMANAESGRTIQTTIDLIVAYNFGSTGYFGGNSLNRTSVYTYWLTHQNFFADPLGLLFGHGLGSSFGGINEPNPWHMDQVHAYMYIGLTAASTILWDLGLVGLLLVLALFMSAFRYASRLALDAQPGFDRATCRALLAMVLMLFIMFFYSDGAISVPSQEVLMSLTLGLIAWRWRSIGRDAVPGRMRVG